MSAGSLVVPGCSCMLQFLVVFGLQLSVQPLDGAIVAPVVVFRCSACYGLCLFSPTAFESYLSVSNTMPDVVLLDPLRVRQIIANGITNALKYTRSGSVQLHVRAQACMLFPHTPH